MADSNSAASAALLSRLKEGPDDQDAWDTFHRTYGPLILKWCRQRGLQEADARDLAQNILLQFARRVRRFEYDPQRSFNGWLFKLTHDTWCAFLQSRRNRSIGEGGSEALIFLESVEARDELKVFARDESNRELLELAMKRVRDRVQPQTWGAFHALAFEELSGQEVEARIGMNRGTAFAAKSKVLRMIRDELSRLDPDGR